MKWKKINYGLVLGAVLLVFLTGFIIVKNVQFRSETAKIRASAVEFTEKFFLLNENPEETLGAERTADEKEARLRELNELIRTYWDTDTAADVSGLYYYTLSSSSELMASFEEYLNRPVGLVVRDLTFQVSDREISVAPNGTDFAVVTIELSDLSLSAEYSGSGVLFDGNGVDYYSGPKSKSSGVYASSYTGSVTLELHRVGGEWKVIGFGTVIFENTNRLIEGGEES